MARVVAVVAGAALVVLGIAVLSAPAGAGNPGRALRGLALVIVLGLGLLWWGVSGRGL